MALEYLVDPINGDDLAPGTPSDPWRTTKHAGRALARLDANGQDVWLYLARGTHGALVLPGTPLNLAMAHYDQGLIVEGDGGAGEVVIAVPDGTDWAIHNAARATFRNLKLTGNPASGGVKCDSRLTVLDNVEFENVPLPLRVMEFSRLEARDLVLRGNSNEFISIYGNADAEIERVTFDDWSYDENFALFQGANSCISLDEFDFSGATVGANSTPYVISPMSVLYANGLIIPGALAGVVDPDGRFYV